MGYHPCSTGFLTSSRDPAGDNVRWGSLTGRRLRKGIGGARVPSEWLETIRRVQRQKGADCDTTVEQVRKVGLSDPVASGNAIAQRIKATLGITGLSLPRVHIDGVVWHLDVGSSHPGAVVGPKGWAVRPLKRYASWVQNVVRQFGPYPAWA